MNKQEFLTQFTELQKVFNNKVNISLRESNTYLVE